MRTPTLIAIILPLLTACEENMLESRESAIILGTVTQIEETAPSSIISEKDPKIRLAYIEVERVLKGPNKQLVVIAFASSEDIMWFDAPKFKPGDTGAWILDNNDEHILDLFLKGYTGPKPYAVLREEQFISDPKQLKRLGFIFGILPR